MRIHKRLNTVERALRRQIVREKNAELAAMSAATSDEELLATVQNTEPHERFQHVTDAQLQTLIDVGDALYIAGASGQEIDRRLREIMAKWERGRK
jgi:hypothetical protein